MFLLTINPSELSATPIATLLKVLLPRDNITTSSNGTVFPHKPFYTPRTVAEIAAGCGAGVAILGLLTVWWAWREIPAGRTGRWARKIADPEAFAAEEDNATDGTRTLVNQPTTQLEKTVENLVEVVSEQLRRQAAVQSEKYARDHDDTISMIDPNDPAEEKYWRQRALVEFAHERQRAGDPKYSDAGFILAGHESVIQSTVQPNDSISIAGDGRRVKNLSLQQEAVRIKRFEHVERIKRIEAENVTKPEMMEKFAEDQELIRDFLEKERERLEEEDRVLKLSDVAEESSAGPSGTQPRRLEPGTSATDWGEEGFRLEDMLSGTGSPLGSHRGSPPIPERSPTRALAPTRTASEATTTSLLTDEALAAHTVRSQAPQKSESRSAMRQHAQSPLQSPSSTQPTSQFPMRSSVPRRTRSESTAPTLLTGEALAYHIASSTRRSESRDRPRQLTYSERSDRPMQAPPVALQSPARQMSPKKAPESSSEGTTKRYGPKHPDHRQQSATIPRTPTSPGPSASRPSYEIPQPSAPTYQGQRLSTAEPSLARGDGDETYVSSYITEVTSPPIFPPERAPGHARSPMSLADMETTITDDQWRSEAGYNYGLSDKEWRRQQQEREREREREHEEAERRRRQ